MAVVSTASWDVGRCAVVAERESAPPVQTSVPLHPLHLLTPPIHHSHHFSHCDAAALLSRYVEGGGCRERYRCCGFSALSATFASPVSLLPSPLSSPHSTVLLTRNRCARPPHIEKAQSCSLFCSHPTLPTAAPISTLSPIPIACPFLHC